MQIWYASKLHRIYLIIPPLVLVIPLIIVIYKQPNTRKKFRYKSQVTLINHLFCKTYRENSFSVNFREKKNLCERKSKNISNKVIALDTICCYCKTKSTPPSILSESKISSTQKNRYNIVKPNTFLYPFRSERKN